MPGRPDGARSIIEPTRRPPPEGGRLRPQLDAVPGEPLPLLCQGRAVAEEARRADGTAILSGPGARGRRRAAGRSLRARGASRPASGRAGPEGGASDGGPSTPP